MDTLVLKFSRWRSRERGFLKSGLEIEFTLGGQGRAGHLAEQDAGLDSEFSPQVVKRPLRGPRPDTVAVAKK
jgi:hypothetical protein